MRGAFGIRTLSPLVLAGVAAELAARLLTPSGHTRRAPAVDPRDYFSDAEIRRGARYAPTQMLLGLARTGVEAGLLVLLVRRARLQTAGSDGEAAPGTTCTKPAGEAARAGETPREAVAGAAFGSGIALGATAASLPIAAVARRRALKVGLVTQSWRGWGLDIVKAAAIEGAFAAVTGAGIVALARRHPRHWWACAAGGAVALGAVVAGLAPVVLDPVFNDFRPLPKGPLRDDVLALARLAGVRVGEVLVIDASRRTTAANAYVAGLGPTKRVVLFDTLIDRYDRDEVRTVVAHELSHVRHRDMPRAVAYLALVAGPAALAVQRLSWALAPGREGTAAALPALTLAAGGVWVPLGLIACRMSRAIERRADDAALRLSGAPHAFVSFERKISVQNVSDVRVPRLPARILATHPPTVERLGAAVAHGAG